MPRFVALAVLCCALAASSAHAVVYCKSVGVPKGCVAAPAPRVAAPGVGAPGVGVVDPGINQPGAAGNVGAAGVGTPANRGGPVDRAGRR